MSKDALLDAAWPGVHVTEDSLFQAVREARRAIGDEKGRVLRSVPRRATCSMPWSTRRGGADGDAAFPALPPFTTRDEGMGGAGDGWAASEWEFRRPVAATAENAHLEVQLARRDAAGAVMGRFGSLRVVTRAEGDGRWRCARTLRREVVDSPRRRPQKHGRARNR